MAGPVRRKAGTVFPRTHVSLRNNFVIAAPSEIIISNGRRCIILLHRNEVGAGLRGWMRPDVEGLRKYLEEYVIHD